MAAISELLGRDQLAALREMRKKLAKDEAAQGKGGTVSADSTETPLTPPVKPTRAAGSNLNFDAMATQALSALLSTAWLTDSLPQEPVGALDEELVYIDDGYGGTEVRAGKRLAGFVSAKLPYEEILTRSVSQETRSQWPVIKIPVNPGYQILIDGYAYSYNEAERSAFWQAHEKLVAELQNYGWSITSAFYPTSTGDEEGVLYGDVLAVVVEDRRYLLPPKEEMYAIDQPKAFATKADLPAGSIDLGELEKRYQVQQFVPDRRDRNPGYAWINKVRRGFDFLNLTVVSPYQGHERLEWRQIDWVIRRTPEAVKTFLQQCYEATYDEEQRTISAPTHQIPRLLSGRDIFENRHLVMLADILKIDPEDIKFEASLPDSTGFNYEKIPLVRSAWDSSIEEMREYESQGLVLFPGEGMELWVIQPTREAAEKYLDKRFGAVVDWDEGIVMCAGDARRLIGTKGWHIKALGKIAGRRLRVESV